MKWQPIETAPKDETRVLVAFQNGQVAIGFWGQKFSTYGAKLGHSWGWGLSWFAEFTEPPTHWMPLPEPPEVHL